MYDFNKILQKAYDAEFIPPAATSMTDVRNFDKEFTSEPAAGSLDGFEVLICNSSYDSRSSNVIVVILVGVYWSSSS